jgi:hypothetical protein
MARRFRASAACDLRSYLSVALLIIGGFCFLHGPFNQVPASLVCMAALLAIGMLYVWRQWPVAGTTHALLGVCFVFSTSFACKLAA